MDIDLPGTPVESTILGLDLSLTGMGWSVLTDGRDIDCGTLKSKQTGMERLDEILSFIAAKASAMRGRKLAVIEGYGFATQKAHSQGELGGVVRLHLWRSGIEYLLVPPSTLKKFVTGQGNGDKGNVMVGLYKSWGIDAGENNAADACACAIMGYHWMCPDMTAPKYRREFVKKIAHVPARPIPPASSAVRTRTRSLQLVAS